ncbi:mutS protein homolog 4-like [Bacillus rossius redtenbacheri]|uniref:mutS protein homolog 4-like n=1 Tax=Bacillus rossius redtenbacheri TaxID=93214 RepID=UPI002FDCF1C8
MNVTQSDTYLNRFQTNMKIKGRGRPTFTVPRRPAPVSRSAQDTLVRARPSSTSTAPRTSTSKSTSANSDRFKTPLQRPSTSDSSGPRGRTTSSSVTTPRSTTTGEDESCCIVAVCEGRGHARGEVGIAAVNILHPSLVLCQISDSQSYHNVLTKMNIFNPVEIIVPNTFCDGMQPSKLFVVLSDFYQCVTPVQRRHFNDTAGLQHIQRICVSEYASVEMLITPKSVPAFSCIV